MAVASEEEEGGEEEDREEERGRNVGGGDGRVGSGKDAGLTWRLVR